MRKLIIVPLALIVAFSFKFVSCDWKSPDYHINCNQYDMEEVKVSDIDIIYDDQSNSNIDDLILKLNQPFECSNTEGIMVLRTNQIQLFQANDKSVPTWECLKIKSTTDPSKLNFLKKACRDRVDNFDWNLLSKKSISADSIQRGIGELRKNYSDPKLRLYIYNTDAEPDNNNFVYNKIKLLQEDLYNTLCEKEVSKISILVVSRWPIDTSTTSPISPNDIIFSDDALTKVKEIVDPDEKLTRLTDYDAQLEVLLKEDPNWRLWYYRARNQMLINQTKPNPANRKNAVDYFGNAAHDAIDQREASELLALIQKYENDELSPIINTESVERAEMVGTKEGLSKNDKGLINVPINFLVRNNKGDNVVHILKLDTYTYYGNSFSKIRITCMDLDNVGNVKLDIQWPKKDGRYDVFNSIILKTGAIEQIETSDDHIITLQNETGSDKNFSTIGLKIKGISDPEPGKRPNPEVEVKKKDEGVTKVSKVDKCPNRNGPKDGCPEFKIELSSEKVYHGDVITYSINPSEEILPNDDIKWTASNNAYIAEYSTKTVEIEFFNVGKYTIAVSVRNTDLNAEDRIVQYVGIKKAELSRHFLEIAEYGNYAKLGNKAKKELDEGKQSKTFIETISNGPSVKAIKRINGTITDRGTLSELFDILMRPKSSAESTITSFEVLAINYSPENGLISSIEYGMK